MRIGIAAAGSGGHLYPAFAVAESLMARGVEREDIIFFGGDRMEKTKVPEAGFPFIEVDIHGLRRSLSMSNLKLPNKVRVATRKIAEEIVARKIVAMLVFGGYVSGPAALAASRCGIPLVVHEANSVPGLANRMVARRADLVLAAIEPATQVLKGSVVVGNPLRSAFEEFDRQALRITARERFGIPPDAEVLAVVGGSLGAAALNAVARDIGESPGRTFYILQLTGEAHVEEVEQWAKGTTNWVVRGFENHMEYVYAAADLVISRSGALTIAELEATATPAIIVPLPAGRGYQALNAAELEAAGGAIIVDQSASDTIVKRALELMADPERRDAMAASAARTGRRGAADAVASMTLELVDA